MSIRKYTDDAFCQAVRGSTSIRQVLMRLGLKGAGGNYWLAKKRIKDLGLSVSHFLGQGYLKGKNHTWAKKIPLSAILIKDSPYRNTNKLRKRLFNEGLFEKKCQGCGNKEWQGVPIPLELEHINGISNDHRKENLRILCPNCHALTPTYRGKNIGNYD